MSFPNPDDESSSSVSIGILHWPRLHGNFFSNFLKRDEVRKLKKILLILWSLPVYSLQAHKSDTLLIKMGPFVYEVMSVTGVNISILSKENLSQVASKDDEMLEIRDEPVDLFRVDGYYNNLPTFIDKAVDNSFIKSSQRHIIVSAPNVKKLFQKLEKDVLVHNGAIAKTRWEVEQ
ncbi:Cytokinin riboside 5'-monophosphate phosphoribohydrolase LOG5 [Vitis vinifera]|uniref:cytokinin riboside 5'-monophosphate phosphoribohydrolase n=1 Tax=Vitis vinifera TaxID=29760 RepID=A0A438IME1_VITVI|nr:Cytokinin riboside 5'-monophosphate phosphoribohydrolase LOG5 [Vitis vinifera]